MAKFKVGEVAVLVQPAGVTAAYSALPFIGDDVLITAPLGSRYMEDGTPKYRIRFPDGDIGYATEICLRKKHPPEEPKDIADTRKKGAPSWDKLMEDLRAGAKAVDTCK